MNKFTELMQDNDRAIESVLNHLEINGHSETIQQLQKFSNSEIQDTYNYIFNKVESPKHKKEVAEQRLFLMSYMSHLRNQIIS